MRLDVCLCLTFLQHELHRRPEVIREIRSGQEVVGAWHHQKFRQGLHRLGEETLGHAQPKVVEVLMEDVKVLMRHGRVEVMSVRPSEHAFKDGVEHGLGGEISQAARAPFFIPLRRRQVTAVF